MNWAHSKMGCEVDVTRHVTCHITTISYIMAMSSATSSSMSSLCDMAIESVTKIILFVTLIFVIENGVGLGYDENLRNVTRCDL